MSLSFTHWVNSLCAAAAAGEGWLSSWQSSACEVGSHQILTMMKITSQQLPSFVLLHLLIINLNGRFIKINGAFELDKQGSQRPKY
jgi:hypothetical protein